MGNRFRRWGLPAAVSVQRKSAERLPSLEARGLLLTILLLPPDTWTSVDELADMLEDCPRRTAAHAMRTLVVYRHVVYVRYQRSGQKDRRLNGTFTTEVLHKDVPFTVSDLLDVAYDYGPGVLIDSWRGTDKVNDRRELVHVSAPKPLEARSTMKGAAKRFLVDREAPLFASDVAAVPALDPDWSADPVDNSHLPRSDRVTDNGTSVPPAETPGSPHDDRATDNGQPVPPAETGPFASSDRPTVDRGVGERRGISSSPPSVRPLGGRTDGGDHSSDRGDGAAAKAEETERSEGPREAVVQQDDCAPETSKKTKTSYSPEAWRLVAALPWPAGQRPTRPEAAKLARRLDEIVADEELGLDLADLEEHLTGRLGKAGTNPPVYLLGALNKDRLPVPRLRPAEAPTVEAQEETLVEVEMPAPPSAAGSEASRLQTFEWCGECKQRSRVKAVRKAGRAKGFEYIPCEKCHPDGRRLVIDVQSPVAALPAAGTPDTAESALSGPLKAESGAL